MNTNSSLMLYLTGLVITVAFLYAIEMQKKLDVYDKPIYFEKETLCIRKSFLCVLIAFFPLWYLMAFRGITVGTDTIGTYYRIYKCSLRNYPISTFGTEFGYYVLNRLIMTFAHSYHVVLIVVSSLIWFLYFTYICKNSVSPTLSIVVFFLTFFYFRQYNGVRQLLAEAIALHGLQYIYKQKFVKYCIVIGIAFCFHNTAIILLPMYFLYKIKLSPRLVLGIIAIAKLGSSFIIGAILPRAIAGTKYYGMILDKRAYLGGYWVSDIIVSGTMLLFCMFIVGLDNDPEINFNSWLILISFVIAIDSNVFPAVGRVLWYSNINVMICVPLVISKFQKRLDKAIAFGTMMIVFTMYFYQQWSLGIERVQHYVFWNDTFN